MTKTRKTFMKIFILLLMGGVVLTIPEQAYAKKVSSCNKVITLTSKKKSTTHKLSISGKEKVFVKIKFLEVKGKSLLPTKHEDLFFGGYECGDGMGSFFSKWSKPNKLKRNSFKKGKTLKSTDDYITGKSTVEWSIPKGIKKLKVRVTYYTKSGKSRIKSIK